MSIINFNILKRFLLYSIFAILWSLLFVLIFPKVMGYEKLFYSFWLDCILLSLFAFLVVALLAETNICFTLKKAKMIKAEVEADYNINLDNSVYYVGKLPKVYEGWLFLTENALIFRSLNRRKPLDLFIPIQDIDYIQKYRLVYNIVIDKTVCFQVNKKWFDIISEIKSKYTSHE